MDWFIHSQGQQIGPIGFDEALSIVMQDHAAVCWKQGMEQWAHCSQVDEFASAFAPPEPPVQADAITYSIVGERAPYLELTLEAGDCVVADAGAMLYKSSSVTMNTVHGNAPIDEKILKRLLLGGEKRLLNDPTSFITVFAQESDATAQLALTVPLNGEIISLSLAEIEGGAIICQRDHFLAAGRGVSISTFLKRQILGKILGDDGLVMQKLEGEGRIFLNAHGAFKEVSLAADEVLHVDAMSVVAFEPTVHFEVVQVGDIQSTLWREGVFLSELRGAGRVWLQTQSASRVFAQFQSAVNS